MAFDSSNVLNGTHGQVWLEDEEIEELKSFQAKDEYEKEAIGMAGKMHKGYKIMSVEGKGSVAFHKTCTRLPYIVGRKVRAGITPKFKMIFKLSDPCVEAYGHERIMFKGVVFDDLTLADAEVGALGSVECPFTYEDYEFLDRINYKEMYR